MGDAHDRYGAKHSLRCDHHRGRSDRGEAMSQQPPPWPSLYNFFKVEVIPISNRDAVQPKGFYLHHVAGTLFSLSSCAKVLTIGCRYVPVHVILDTGFLRSCIRNMRYLCLSKPFVPANSPPRRPRPPHTSIYLPFPIPRIPDVLGHSERDTLDAAATAKTTTVGDVYAVW